MTGSPDAACLTPALARLAEERELLLRFGELLVEGVDLVLELAAARIRQAQREAALLDLERIAREKGSAVGLAGPLRPVTIERIAEWARTLDARGLVLVPVSALTAAP